ncbi:MAG: UvrB/UvrC motif-containing protein [Verrucomicrobia bacterium]|nr:UvrB/UvrC motif-containing protein [Verrucomicrobiota bacterium]
MQCDVCHKTTPTVFLTQVVEGELQKINLCQHCADKNGVTDTTGFNLAELLRGVGAQSRVNGLYCANCGFTNADFKKSGRLGCSECYEVFHGGLESLLKAMHTGTRHLGKRPGEAPPPPTSRTDYSGQIDTLRKRLSASVEAENYEEAAKLRDELRRLECRMLDSEP